MKDLKKEILKFRDDRNWKQFHTPENLSKSISIEAAELLEHFQWNSDFDKEKVCEELADVAIYAMLMADSLEVELEDIIKSKLKKNGEKYPIEKSKGNSRKYTEL
ncbi:MAG: nucleotide pyrophosphohydrolase [Clostridiaceae bacterium]